MSAETLPILIVDDEAAVARALERLLSGRGFLTRVENTPAAAIDAVREETFGAVISDMNFSPERTDGDEGTALFKAIRELDPELPVVLMTAWASLERAVSLVREGAADYVEKPWDPDKLLPTLKNLIDLRATKLDNRRLRGERERERDELQARFDLGGLVYKSPAMHRAVALAAQVARSEAPVLITGENGVGKEVIADLIQRNSTVRAGPYVRVNAGALPSELLEAELFGTVRGSFTGSTRDTQGLIRSAHKGTLFLDEVAEMPLELQAKLLRVLESRQVQPIGGHEAVNVDVRILSATHRSLRSEVEAGRFRADLMYRLRVIPIFLPPLRERRPDIALLAHHLIQELNEKQGRRHIETISPTALAALTACSWPGNVRELKNALQYAVAMGDGPVLTVAELPAEVRSDETWMPTSMTTPSSPPSSTPATTAGVGPERGLIEQVLSEADGNRDAAARALGISRVTLWRWMKEAGIAVRRRRP